MQEGGQLVIRNVEPGRDQGIYTCIVRSRAGEEARRDMQLNVNSKLRRGRRLQLDVALMSATLANRSPGPPVIEAFKFPKNLQEGGRAQITCAVSSGDMPIYFSWRKDDSVIPLSLQVSWQSKDVELALHLAQLVKHFYSC